jgi:NadR type nicotinamide-nucleotide adenylyltransferase
MEKRSVRKIAVIGAESTGKTWLCESLAKHYATVWVPEYARDYFHDSDIYNFTMEDLVKIAEKQIALEEELFLKAKDFLFCDTTLITLKMWAELDFQRTPPIIEDNLPKIKYDHYFITNNEMPWVKDPLRQNKHSRDLLMEMNITEVKKLGMSYSIISGKDDERLKNAIQILESL